MEPRVVEETIDNEGKRHPGRAPRSSDRRHRSGDESIPARGPGWRRERGTAAAAFSDFGEGVENVGGKTGTAQVSATRDNHAWFVGVAPSTTPSTWWRSSSTKVGPAAGGSTVARHIMQYLTGNEPTPIVEGEEAD